jgi:hypothetical protein
MGVNLSDTGMACAMCHPFGKDTNPHEFPKFQEQMSEFATLRDMTNWCIDNPNEGEMIDVDSPAMKALEAYQYWSHTGVRAQPRQTLTPDPSAGGTAMVPRQAGRTWRGTGARPRRGWSEAGRLGRQACGERRPWLTNN